MACYDKIEAEVPVEAPIMQIGAPTSANHPEIGARTGTAKKSGEIIRRKNGATVGTDPANRCLDRRQNPQIRCPDRHRAYIFQKSGVLGDEIP